MRPRTIQLRLTEAEHEELRRRAGGPIGPWLRRLALGSAAEPDGRARARSAMDSGATPQPGSVWLLDDHSGSPALLVRVIDVFARSATARVELVDETPPPHLASVFVVSFASLRQP